MEVITGDGEGSIITSDFVYSIVVRQSESDASKYEVIRGIDEIKNPAIMHDAGFNQVFEKYFR